VLFAIVTKGALGAGKYQRERRVRLYPANKQSLKIYGQQ